MKTIYAVAYVSVALALAAFVGSLLVNQNQASTVESTYNVKVISKEVSLTGPNKLVIEKDGQRLRCYSPSSDDIKNKTPLNCDTVTRINAEK
jgi:hypothetical protein